MEDYLITNLVKQPWWQMAVGVQQQHTGQVVRVVLVVVFIQFLILSSAGLSIQSCSWVDFLFLWHMPDDVSGVELLSDRQSHADINKCSDSSEWVAPGDTAILGTTRRVKIHLQHSMCIGSFSKRDIMPQPSRQKLIRNMDNPSYFSGPRNIILEL